jgi:hypothetical protein
MVELPVFVVVVVPPPPAFTEVNEINIRLKNRNFILGCLNL